MYERMAKSNLCVNSDPSSPYKPWLDVMPTSFNSPTFFTEQVINHALLLIELFAKYYIQISILCTIYNFKELEWLEGDELQEEVRRVC